eukprot:5253899-Pleurochrysis_carterae.AAC.2
MDERVTPFCELAVGGDDFNSAVWSLSQMASSVIGAATEFCNLRPLNAANPFLSLRKVQLQFDGISWTRGHGCTRLRGQMTVER